MVRDLSAGRQLVNLHHQFPISRICGERTSSSSDGHSSFESSKACFCRMVALRDPASVGIVTRVLSIPVKRTDKRLVRYLTRAEIDALLAANDLKVWAGRRDHALLLTR